MLLRMASTTPGSEKTAPETSMRRMAPSGDASMKPTRTMSLSSPLSIAKEISARLGDVFGKPGHAEPSDEPWLTAREDFARQRPFAVPLVSSWRPDAERTIRSDLPGGTHLRSDVRNESSNADAWARVLKTSNWLPTPTGKLANAPARSVPSCAAGLPHVGI